jgi:5'-nucleotidase-like protein
MRVSGHLLAYSVCAFTLTILVSRPMHGQDSKPSTKPGETAPTTGGPTGSASTAAAGEVNLFYSSQLFGYFREPDLQPRDSHQGCADWVDHPSATQKDASGEHTTAEASPAATAFHALWTNQQSPGKILVGTGDNLAPVLWTRQFDPTTSATDQQGKGKRTAKELFTWDPDKRGWVLNETLKKENNYGPLLDRLKHGEGTIPTDNAACFLRHAGYAAIVPGKYDFYFGPDRLRQLARFLAGKKECRHVADTECSDAESFHPVQMLGANLVIETTWKNDHKSVGDTEDPPKFAPWAAAKFKVPSKLSDGHSSTTAQKGNPSADRNLTNQQKDAQSTAKPPDVPTVMTPKDGGQVYPWFPGAELKLADLSHASRLSDILKSCWNKGAPDSRNSSVDLCGDSDSGEYRKRYLKQEFEEFFKKLLKGKFEANDDNKDAYTKVLYILDNFPTAKVYLCHSTAPGNPNKIAPPDYDGCRTSLGEPEVRLKRDVLEYFYAFPESSTHSFATLTPGQNYGLCMRGDTLEPVSHDPEKNFYCSRFSVYTPFFQFPFGNTAEDCAKHSTKCAYQDPNPYKLIEAKDHPDQDVVIFGVVDPQMGENVGMLNSTWSNSHPGEYKTQTVAKDPAQALTELLSYFERRYDEEHHRRFNGVRVLLAQISPQGAQVLAARVGRFDVVVSEANPELAGVGEARKLQPEPGTPRRDGTRHAFLAIPEPYWVSDRNPEERVDLGQLTIVGPAPQRTITSKHLLGPLPTNHLDVKAPGGFWEAVGGYVREKCLASPANAEPALTDSSINTEKEKAMQDVTACVMQKEVNADVVLLQERDFYFDWEQYGSKDFTPQSFIDRLIWKGDFLTLLYVPGSTLQTVMKQSKAFDEDDNSQLSLSNQRYRGLIASGILFDSNKREYLVNETPLDPKRVYAVATTDFVAAGDTGYPDLATNAIRQLSTPDDFDANLRTVSSLVCLKIASYLKVASENRDHGCQEPIPRDYYFDEIAASPTDTREGDTVAHQLWSWSIFDINKPLLGGTASAQPKGVDAHIQRRRLGSIRINQPDTTLFALNNAALNLNMLNHKFSDATLANTFVGNPTPQLSAKRSHIIGYDIQPKFLYSWHRYQLFETTEFRYDIQYTGNLNAPRTINQKDNLYSSDTGFVLDMQDRTLPHVEAVGTFHYEAQLVHPTVDSLAPLPKGATFAPGTNTARTHYFLPRVGVRYVNRTSWIEAGLEDGGELNAVRLVLPPAGQTQYGLFRTDVNVSGTYWRWHLVVPFGEKVSWTVDEDGDFFFNERGDAFTDTRFHSDAKTAVNFQVFPSLTFAPTYEFFYYANKVQQNWFWQNQASIQMKVRFDFWNHRRWPDQLKYKIPSSTN